MGKPWFIAGFDSASAMLMATGSALRGEAFPVVGGGRLAKPILRFTRFLPRRVRAGIFTLAGATEGISPRRTGRIDVEDASRWVVDQYPEKTYAGAVIGSASGALVYLCTALGMPWLPQTYLVPLRQRVHADDPHTAVDKVKIPAARFLAANPAVSLHHMHDPVQDRKMVRVLSYLRYKKLSLGAEFEDFLEKRIDPSGVVVITECTSQWDVTEYSERHTFQFGGMGGATETELHHGGPRVREFLKDQGAEIREWSPPASNARRPESEWGFATTLRDDVRAVSARLGLPVRRLIFDHPDALSPMVADLYRWWYRRRGIPTNRLFIGSFAIHAPWWALRTGSVPYWMFFNEETSMERLITYLDSREPFDEILLTLVQNAVTSIGQPPSNAWQEVLDRATIAGRYAGSSLDAFPFDIAHLGMYEDAIREYPERFDPPLPLTLAEFEEFLEQAGPYPGVEWKHDV